MLERAMKEFPGFVPAALGTYYYSLDSHFQARAIHVKAEEI